MYQELLNQRLAVLQQQTGVTVRVKKIAGGIAAEVVRAIEAEIPFKLDAELLSFYQEMNGVELSWSVQQPDQEIYGSIFILPLTKGIFGYGEAIALVTYDNAFDEILWNEDSFEEDSIAELKKHRVFETVEGLPVAVTYKPKMSQKKLYYVDEETIKPLVLPFTDYVKVLFQYLGAENIRELLTSKQWEKQVKENQKLQTVAKWTEKE